MQKKSHQNKVIKRKYLENGVRSSKISKKKPFSRIDKEVYKKIFIVIGILLVLLSIFFGYEVYSRQLEFNNQLKSSVKRLDESSCKLFNKSLINTFLDIETDNDSNIINSTIYIFSDGSQFGLNINDYKFDIDNIGTQGTLKELIQTNNLFLDKKSVFKYLSGYFYKQFNLKIDSVIISKQNFPLREYIKLNSYGVLQKVFDQKNNINQFLFYTDLCLEDFNFMLGLVYSNPNGIEKFNYEQDLSIANLFTLDQIKKEQIRIQILNSSGVEQWGSFIVRLFKSYGLNIVKLDSTIVPIKTTQISIDKDEIKNGNTLKVIKYLLLNQIEDKDIKFQENIYSDIYIILGQDSLI